MNQSFKATKTAVALAVLGLVSGAALAETTTTTVTLDPFGSNYVITKDTQTINQSKDFERLPEINGMTVEKGATASLNGITTTENKPITLKGSSLVAETGTFTANGSNQAVTIDTGATFDNKGRADFDTLTVKGTVNTGMFADKMESPQQHLKFETLNLEQGGAFNIVSAPSADAYEKLTATVNGARTGLDGTVKLSAANGDLAFTDGEVNFNGGTFALNVGTAEKPVMKSEGLNVYVIGTDVTANFTNGSYVFGTVETLGTTAVTVGAEEGKSIALKADKLTLASTGSNTINNGTISVGTLDAHAGTLTMEGGDLTLGSLTASSTVNFNGGTLSFTSTKATEPTYDITVTNEKTTFGEGFVVANPVTVKVAGTEAGTELAINNDLTITDLVVDKANSKVTVGTTGELTLDGALKTDATTSVLTVDGQLNLTENSKFLKDDGKTTVTNQVVTVNGTLSTDSSFFKTDTAAEPANGGYEDNDALTLTDATVSFTDETMDLQQLTDLHNVLTGVGGFEVLADTITQTSDKGVVSPLTELDIADWDDIGNATLKSVSAVVNSTTINTTAGAKNIIVDEATANTTDASLTVNAGKTLTLVGGEQGTELVVGRDKDKKPVDLKPGTLTVNGTLNFGLANNTVKTYGHYNGDIANSGMFTVQNGDFELSEGLKNETSSTTTIEDGASLTVKDVLEDGTVTTSSIVNEGTLNVNGILNAQTVVAGSNFTVSHTGTLNASSITSGNVTLEGGVAVVDVAKKTGEGATGYEATIGGTGTVTIKQDSDKFGGLLVLGQSSAANAQAYRQLHTAENVLWIGQETALKGNAAFDTKGTIAIDIAGLRATGYQAVVGEEDKAIITGTIQNADKLVVSGLQYVDHSMLSYDRIDGIYSLNVGTNVTPADTNTVDVGSVFYAPTYQNGMLTLNVDKDSLGAAKELGLNTYGAIESAVNNVSFGQNAVADAVIFGLSDENLADQKFLSALVNAEHAVTNMAAYSGAFSTLVDINNEITGALDRRSSLANLNAARNATGITPWVDVIGTWNTADGLYGKTGYEADIYGAVLGADWTASCGAILGAAVSVGQADANSVDSATKVENDADFWGLSIYGSHQIGSVNGKFDIGYVSVSNDLSANSGFFGNVKESLDASIFTVGLGAEYLVNAGAVNVVPHAGIRWSRLDMDDSKFGADYDAMNLFQMPVGVAFSGTIDMNGWKLAPMADVSVVPAFGDKDAVANFAGGITDTVRVVDTNPIQATLGLNAQVDAWTFGINYRLTAGGDDRLNNSLNANARYTF